MGIVLLAVWRERGTHCPMCGEYAFEVKFKRRSELHEKRSTLSAVLY